MRREGCPPLYKSNLTQIKVTTSEVLQEPQPGDKPASSGVRGRVSGQTGSRVSAAARIVVPGPVCVQGRLAAAANRSQSQWLITVKVSFLFVSQSREAYCRRGDWETVLHAVTQGPRLLPTSGSTIPQSRSQQAFSVMGQIVNIF